MNRYNWLLWLLNDGEMYKNLSPILNPFALTCSVMIYTLSLSLSLALICIKRRSSKDAQKRTHADPERTAHGGRSCLTLSSALSPHAESPSGTAGKRLQISSFFCKSFHMRTGCNGVLPRAPSLLQMGWPSQQDRDRMVCANFWPVQP